VLTAHAAFFCFECLVVVGLVSQVGVKSNQSLAVAWRFMQSITFGCFLLRAAAQFNRWVANLPQLHLILNTAIFSDFFSDNESLA
jgi:hypothetical protein